MKFHVEVQPRGDSPVWYETDEIKLCVGQIGRDKGGFIFHHGALAAPLKPAIQAELKAFAADQITVMRLTQRMLK